MITGPVFRSEPNTRFKPGVAEPMSVPIFHSRLWIKSKGVHLAANDGTLSKNNSAELQTRGNGGCLRNIDGRTGSKTRISRVV